ncbi:MAG TPA: DUF512 domain-containing protein [Candidatus Anaerofilum excrementigallinarum]|nr:DUF512 domain-containing protein [Candidatus Anaerofilum excrementigallinarum]
MAVKIASVQPGSAAQKAGLTAGTVLLSAGGKPINDILDYEFYTAAPRLELAVSRGGKLEYITVEKEEYQPLGCDFESYLIDKHHSCKNHCMFCFIDQLPKGLRESLYFKDDDERLSFLFGNYITLTNLSEQEVQRIIEMHISPVNISVHTTDPALRVRMMANKRAGEVLRYLDDFAAAGIQMNCQLVLCRGINDGDQLRASLDKLLSLYPAVQSIAAVPAGLTDHRQGLYKLTAYDAATAAETLDILEEYGDRCAEKYGVRLVYPGDEWFLLAGRPIPPAEYYDDYLQLENGVGMWRSFHDSFLEELEASRRLFLPRKMDVVTGTMAAPLIQDMVNAARQRHKLLRVEVHPIQNDFFGGNVGVAGLVTGTDIIKQCRGRLKSRLLGVPEVMLRTEQDMFLDDVTIPQLEKELKVKVQIIPADGAGTLRALLGQQAEA